MDMILASGPLFILAFILLAIIGAFGFIVKQATKNQYKDVKVNRIDEKEEAKRKKEKEKAQTKLSDSTDEGKDDTHNAQDK